MRATGTIFIAGVICVSIVVLWYIGQYTVQSDVVPSLQEYIASSTTDTNIFGSSTLQDDISDRDASVDNKRESDFIQPYQLTLPTSVIKSPRGDIQVFVAKTSESRGHGLSGYPALKPDQGMLFIFPTASTYSFWMKDMNFPIDIIWMNSDKKIVNITRNVSPESYPETFASPGIIQFVIEVASGEAQKHGFELGMTLMF